VFEIPPTRPLLVAHRYGNAVETVPAAVAAGADVIEADVHLHRGQFEIRHTKTLGALPWLWDRWYLVPASEPRLSLAELIAAFPGDALLMLDLKGWQPWQGRAVADAMERLAPGRPYLVSTGAWHMLSAFEHVPNAGIIHTVADRRHAWRIGLRLRRHRTDAIGVRRSLLADPTLAPRLRRLAPVVLTWPVDSHAVAAEVLDRGVNGLIVDGLDLLADLAAAREGRT
jgi:glycerophosphoryl diester phosphodiesterase